jgi:hypothetical protein
MLGCLKLALIAQQFAELSHEALRVVAWILYRNAFWILAHQMDFRESLKLFSKVVFCIELARKRVRAPLL